MILYFTGTGNSRYLAELLAQRLDDKTVNVGEMLKSGRTPEFTSEKPYVFVTPVYAWRIPKVLKEWIEKCRFYGNSKAYFVLDCGSEIGVAHHYVEKLIAKIGLEYKGTAEIVMPENYLVMFDPTPVEKDGPIVAAATAKTEAIATKIAAEETLGKMKGTFVGHVYSDFVNPFFYGFYIGAKKFYATDACISCGKCAEQCMLNNITLKDGRPVWGKDCTHCMACICYCPTMAIEYGKNTKGRRRYRFSVKPEGNEGE